MFPGNIEITVICCVCQSVRDLTWRDLDLIIERPPALPYQKGPLDGALTLVYGTLMGFGGALLLAILVLLVIARVSR